MSISGLISISKYLEPNHPLRIKLEASKSKSQKHTTELQLRERLQKRNSEGSITYITVTNNELLASPKTEDIKRSFQKLCLTKRPELDALISPFIEDLIREKAKNIDTTLGQLLYLIDNFPELIRDTIQPLKREQTVKDIQILFYSKMEIVMQRLANEYKLHANTKLQDPDMAFVTSLPKELAEVLMLSTGEINLGIIVTIIDIFVDNIDTLKNWELDIKTVLELIRHSEKLRKSIEATSKPIKASEPATHVIQTILNLDSTTEITDLHAKKASLSALLSHLRQGNKSSCFATSVAIGLMHKHLIKCQEDFASLLYSSRLVREVKGEKVDFPFLFTHNDDTVEKIYKITKDGVIFTDETETLHIWDAPGIKAACRALNLKQLDIKKVIEESPICLQHAAVKYLLLEMAKYVCKTEECHIPIFRRACFSYGATIKNPLLNVWENALACMAEIHQDSLIRSVWISTIKSALECSNEVVAAILKRTFFRYDPNYTANGISSCATFVLYDKQDWSKIDTPESFKKFIYDITKLPIILHDNFLRNIQEQYQRSISQYESKDTKSTPWLTLIGNDPRKVLQVYHESKSLPATEMFIPLSAEDLLVRLINMTRGTPPEFKKELRSNPLYMTNIRTPGVHAFSLVLGHPSIKKAWDDPKSSPEDWIIKHVKTMGKMISELYTHKPMRKKMIKFAIDNNLVEPHKVAEFTQKLKDLPSTTSRAQFREIASAYIKKLTKFDFKIYQELPESARKHLQNTAVHFADTNWSEKGDDIHFCFVVNPGTGKIEIWEALESGELCRALDQKIWLNKSWEFIKM